MTLRMKFELSFGCALIAMWLGGLWLDAQVLLLSDRQVLQVSTPILALAAYMVWESGKSAWVLADVRHTLVHGVSFPAPHYQREQEPWAHRFDNSLLAGGLIALLASSAMALALALSGHTFERFAGSVSLAVSALFGVVLIATRLGELNGARKALALRIAISSALAAVLVAVRLLDRGSYALGWVGLVGMLVYALWFGVASQNLSGRLPNQAPAAAGRAGDVALGE